MLLASPIDGVNNKILTDNYLQAKQKKLKVEVFGEITKSQMHFHTFYWSKLGQLLKLIEIFFLD